MAMYLVAAGPAAAWFRVTDDSGSGGVLMTINGGRYWTVEVGGSPPYLVELLNNSEQPMGSARTHDPDAVAVAWCPTADSGMLTITQYEAR